MNKRRKLIIPACYVALFFFVILVFILYSFRVSKLKVEPPEHLLFFNTDFGLSVDVDQGWALYAVRRFVNADKGISDVGTVLLHSDPRHSIGVDCTKNKILAYRDFAGNLKTIGGSISEGKTKFVTGSAFCGVDAGMVVGTIGKISLIQPDGKRRDLCATNCRRLLGCADDEIVFLRRNQDVDEVVVMSILSSEEHILLFSDDVVVPLSTDWAAREVLVRIGGERILFRDGVVSKVQWLPKKGWGAFLAGQFILFQDSTGTVFFYRIENGAEVSRQRFSQRLAMVVRVI